MKKAWVLLMAAVLLCCLLPVAALGMEQVEITSVDVHRDGSVTVKWNNPNSGTVTVGCLPMLDTETGNKFLIEKNVTGSSYTFNILAPGVEYLLAVIPGTDTNYAGLELVTVPEPGPFDEFRLSITDTYLTYFVPKGNTYSYNYANELTNERIYELLDEKQFWVRLSLSLSARSSTISCPALTVVTAPNGYVATQYSDLQFKEGWQSFWITMLYMNDAFENMHEACGRIPAGKYKVKLYVDGGLVGQTSFTIME